MGEKKARELWNFNDLKGYLKMSRSTVYQLIAQGKIPHIKIGRHMRFVPEDVERAVRKMPA
jgi:excisionase family DNA binding protein